RAGWRRAGANPRPTAARNTTASPAPAVPGSKPKPPAGAASPTPWARPWPPPPARRHSHAALLEAVGQRFQQPSAPERARARRAGRDRIGFRDPAAGGPQPARGGAGDGRQRALAREPPRRPL